MTEGDPVRLALDGRRTQISLASTEGPLSRPDAEKEERHHGIH